MAVLEKRMTCFFFELTKDLAVSTMVVAIMGRVRYRDLLGLGVVAAGLTEYTTT